MNRRFLILAALTALVLVVAYGPLLWQFFANQWAKPHYQHFPFVIGAFVWLVWQRCGQAVRREGRGVRSEEREPEPGQNAPVWVLPAEERRIRDEEGRGAANRYDVVVALIAAILLLGLAYYANSPWMAYLSAICLVTSTFLRVSRDWRVPYLWGVWLLLWLVVPLPLNRDQYLINWLQGLSSRLSSFVLDWVGVTHLMEGNALILPDKQFFVDEACSGIVSVLSIIACAVIYGVWRNRSPAHLVALATAGVGWATLMNVVRISVIAMAYQWYGVDWSKGTPHETLGLVIFLFTFLALICTDYALVVMLSPIRETYLEQYGDPVTYGAWFVRVWDWLQAWGRPVAYAGLESRVESPEPEGKATAQGLGFRVPGVQGGRRQGDKDFGELSPAEIGRQGEMQSTGPQFAPADVPAPGAGDKSELASRFVLGVVPLAVFALLAGAQFVMPRTAPRTVGAPHNMDRALAIDAVGLPESVHGAERTAFSKIERERDDIFGNYSRLFEYRDQRGNTYQVSCDFPLEPGGHELTACYQGIGWSMTRREVEEMVPGDYDDPNRESSWGYGVADFAKPDGSAGYLAFCSFDEFGARVAPPTRSFWNDFWRAVQKQSQGQGLGRSYTVQVWTVSPGKIREDQKQLARQLLLASRERFLQLVTGQGSGGERGARSEK